MSIPIVSAADEAQPAPQRDIQHYMRPGLLQLSSLPPLSLYVHIPWCLRKCPYCDFNSHAHQGGEALPEQRYLDALCADLEAALPLVWGRQVHSVFIGGGTPSLFAPASIDRLLADIRARLPLAAGCEVTLEANPGTFEKDRFRAFRAAGVTRLSIGVQSFNDPHLQALGRVHDRAQAIAAVEEAQQAFETFNLDLMYALPGQTLPELDADLRTALALAPPHLSVYHLTIEPNTWFAKHPPTVPPDDEAYAMLDHITEHTAQAGLERYEVSAYARSSHQCQHNTNYWEFGDYLGIGAGAHSKLSFAHRIVRQVRFRDPQRYMDQALAGQALAQDNEVRRGDLPFEFMLNALRLRSGFALQDFVERTGLALTAIEAPLQEAERKGLILRDLGRVQPTPRGFDFLSDLQELFL
ncbi:oxygen-independent coproporphyrinogen III oxidase-like protein [Acidovorax sp. 210-6]|uniref:radical SAM family heme chaperone HemW n=1 Tax=Acidovorax sp. 210-6 TaxID=2699468 RepID=UPI001389FF7B|nr:radical SAM family heme chaperone HemW [Acidovorax sp. 210-6]NCU66740.1 oxygen-independent coproporphyrinogen III oxidase-like protein [Acidovorax sp. 210-6]